MIKDILIKCTMNTAETDTIHNNKDKDSHFSSFPFKSIENKWQQIWENQTPSTTKTPDLKKLYVLEMFPYPSGKLHMGHVRNYTIGDAIARYYALKGYQILHPMGWDAFGLPAENAAIQNNTHPKKWTEQNILDMKKQLKMLGLSYDWSKEIATCSPEYYAQQQKLFLDFYNKGLMERKESWVNWDPIDNSVLANEQVINGRGWRSGALVEKKLLKQWSCKITHYADELLQDLNQLNEWPEKVVKMQENWIGKSEGAIVHFKGESDDFEINVFTTRPDTLFGCSFVAISSAHPLATAWSQNDEDMQEFIKECQKTTTTEEAVSKAEKLGYNTKRFVNHPFTQQLVPVYIANFVLMEYGTGAVFGCPAHDERDFEFATKYNLPITQVVDSDDELPYTGEGKIIRSDFLNGLSIPQAKTEAIEALIARGLGERHITFRLRDWLVSRQRYWGCPIPIIHCDSCGVVPVPTADLPVKLPDDVTFDKPGNPLDHHPTWKHVDCPKCGKKAVRETDTLDTFFDSSWYFFRYADNQYASPINSKEANFWAPVDWYIGGIEHAVLHLLYARFFTKVLRDLGYVECDEPFKRLLTQGMVCHETYQTQEGAWLYPYEVTKLKDGSYITTETQKPVVVGGNIKMSKSKKNLVDPLEILASYGADVARLFILSDTPPEKDFDWNTEALDGCWRYINRIWRLCEMMGNHYNQSASETSQDDLKYKAHQFLDKMHDSYSKNAFNKAIAFHREFAKDLETLYKTSSKETLGEALKYFIIALYPIAPHICSEAYERIFNVSFDASIVLPDANPQFTKQNVITIAVQVNGKMRGTFDIEPDSSDNIMVEKALNVETVKNYATSDNLKKSIVIKNRLVNLIVGS